MTMVVLRPCLDNKYSEQPLYPTFMLWSRRQETNPAFGNQDKNDDALTVSYLNSRAASKERPTWVYTNPLLQNIMNQLCISLSETVKSERTQQTYFLLDIQLELQHSEKQALFSRYMRRYSFIVSLHHSRTTLLVAKNRNSPIIWKSYVLYITAIRS